MKIIKVTVYGPDSKVPDRTHYYINREVAERLVKPTLTDWDYARYQEIEVIEDDNNKRDDR